MLRRILLAWSAVGHTFGVWVAPAVTLVLFLGLRLNIAIGMALDNLLFPKLRTKQVKSPIVIVGNPRTGTTFLHRFLVEQGFGAGGQLWRLLYPSLLLQTLLRPFVPWLESVSPARHHATVAHDTNLQSIETDDVAVFFRYFDGFFLYGFFLAWHKQDLQSLFDPEVRDTTDRDFAWWEQVWRRSMVWMGRDRVVAKLFSIGPRTPAFLQRFPDAKILYMARDPLAVIPSGLSLVTGVLDKRFGFWRLPVEVRQQYIERLYRALVMLMERFHRDWTNGAIPREKVMVVRFDRMMADFEGTMAELCAFVGHTPDEALLAEIRRIGEQQRTFSSAHTYDLAKFGLDAERIRRDCGFMYDTFLPPLPAPDVS